VRGGVVLRKGALVALSSLVALPIFGVGCGARTSSSSEAGVRAASPTRPLSERLSRRSDDLPLQTLPQGVVRLRLQGRFAHATLLQREADGVTHRCVDSARSLPRWQQTP
jgi:hypothetical protein